MEQKTSGLAWLALILSVIALVLAFLAFSRVTTLDEELLGGSRDAASNSDVAAERSAALTRLQALEARQSAEVNWEDFQNDFEVARRDLRNSYIEARLQGSDEWAELQDKFDRVSQTVGNRSASALADLRALIADLEESLNNSN